VLNRPLRVWLRAQVITYLDHAAYPEFVVTYKAPYRSELSWPDAGARPARLVSVWVRPLACRPHLRLVRGDGHGMSD
jgi:hypothetical protein